jgi:hypothetical protein
MIILLSEKIINVENSANSGRVLYALLQKKYLKLPGKLTLIDVFMRIPTRFYPNSVTLLELDYFPSSKPLKTISIATS